MLRTGDQVLAVAARGQLGAVEERLRAVSRVGRLAGWHDGPGPADSADPARAVWTQGVPKGLV